MLEHRENTLSSEENKLLGELAKAQEDLDRQLASKNAEIEGLIVEQRAMQSKISVISARAQEAEAKASQLNAMLLAIDSKNGELAILSVENKELRARLDAQTAEIEAMAAERDRLIANIEDRDEIMAILKATHRENIALLSDEHRDIIARQSNSHKAEIQRFTEQNDVLSQEVIQVRESAHRAENLSLLERDGMLSQIEILKSEMEQKMMEIERLSC